MGDGNLNSPKEVHEVQGGVGNVSETIKGVIDVYYGLPDDKVLAVFEKLDQFSVVTRGEGTRQEGVLWVECVKF
jgi:hypothetical protein